MGTTETGRHERDPLAKRLRRATEPCMVQVGPGVWAPRDPAESVPEVVLAVWKPTGNGQYVLMPFRDQMARLNKRLANLLGFRGQYNTLLRLGRAGFIEIVKAAPFTNLINLDSYYNHLRRCAEDPEFWEHEDNRELYRQSL